MLSYKEQIDGLNVEQSILCLSDDPLAGDSGMPSLPHLRVAELWDANETERGKLFPCPEALANSFDPALFAKVSDILAARGEARGNNLFVLPACRAPLADYERALSDDPLLNSHLIAGCAEALAKRGNGFALPAPVMTQADLDALAGETEYSVLYDRIVRPFHDILEKTECPAVLYPKAETDVACRDIMKKLCGEMPRHVTPLRLKMEGEASVQALIEGSVVLEADATAIQVAYENYQRIYRSIEAGGTTFDELHSAQLDGSAISEETIRDVLMRRVTLAQACTEHTSAVAPTAQMIDEVAFEAACGATVLLKNKDNALPFSRGTKIAVIGDAIENGEACEFRDFRREFSQSLKKNLAIGFARGYDLNCDRSDYVQEAVNLAKRADVTLVFLGMGSRRAALIPEMKSLELPANQMALFDALKETGKPLIAVIVGTRLPAMEFDRNTVATLLIPPQGIKVPHALASILEGRSNPSGRLAFAGEDTPDIDYMERQMDILRGEKKVGPFIGYRASVTDGSVVKYPFGYGLSYSQIDYSKFSCDGRRVRIKVKNHGKLPITHAVQIYMGKPTTSLLRPRMELKGIQAVTLKPGEKKTLYIPLEWFGVYNPYSDNVELENGRYHIYVSRYAGNKTLKTRVPMTGVHYPKDRYDISEYLHAVSNICSKHYTMEGFCEPMKTRAALKNLGIFFVLLTLFTTVFYVAGAVLGFYDVFPSVFFMLGIGGALFFTALIFFIVYVSRHGHDVRRQLKREQKSTEDLFRHVRVAEANSLEDLFVEEFDIPEETKKTEAVTYTEEDEGRHVHVQISTDLPTVAANMEKFFSERGVVVSGAHVRTILSSVMTSRFIIVRNASQELMTRFACVLGEFFGTTTGVESFVTRRGEGTLLHRSAGDAQPTSIMTVLTAAQSRTDKPHFAVVTDLAFADAGKYMTPFIRYFSDPNGKCRVKENEENITIPSNFWVLMNAKCDDSLESLEPFVANFATVLDLRAEAVGEQADKQEHPAATCAELETLMYRSRKNTVVDEALWKCVDALEEYVNDRATYHIGNKLFSQMEGYLAVYTNCGGDIHEAMDGAVAAKLLPAIVGHLKDVEKQDDRELLHAIEDMFGDSNVEACRYMLKNMAFAPVAETPAEVSDTTVFSDAVPAFDTETFGAETTEEHTETVADVTEDHAEMVSDAVADGFAEVAPEGAVNDPIEKLVTDTADYFAEEAPIVELPPEVVADETEEAPIPAFDFTAENVTGLESDAEAVSTEEAFADLAETEDDEQASGVN